METIEPSKISPLLGDTVHRPLDLLTVSLDSNEKRRCLRRWVRAVAPLTLVPAPLVAFNAWAVLAESWRTYRLLRAQEREQRVVHGG